MANRILHEDLNGDADRAFPHRKLTEQVIGAGYAIHRSFGFGFLEKVYRRALVLELAHLGINTRREVAFQLQHRGVDIAFYRADLVVEEKVIVEVKQDCSWTRQRSHKR
jgi:GxxExxY protein